MKKIGRLFLFLIISMIGINQAKAEEYGVKIFSDTNIKVYDENEVEITNNIPDIYTYDTTTHTITLKENIHYAMVLTEDYDHHITITSNNKKTYVNMVYGPFIILDKLNSESFTSESNHVWDSLITGDPNTPMMTHVHVGELLVKDSTFILKENKNFYDGIVHTLHDDAHDGFGDITIQNSKFYTNGFMYTDNPKTITIKDNSDVKVSSIGCFNADDVHDKLIVKDSKLEVSRDSYIELFNVKNHGLVINSNITIDNSEIITNAFWSAVTLTINNSNMYTSSAIEKFDIDGLGGKTLVVNNSDVDISGAITFDTITLSNSNLSSQTGPNEDALSTLGFDGSTFSALFANSLELNNSNFKAVSLGDVPAVAIQDGITSNKENFILYNDSYQILDLKNVDLNDKGFFNNPNNYTTVNALLAGKTQGYTGLLNGNASKVVISGESVEMTIKVVNGTWEDGTNEDKHITMILGVIPDKNFIKTYPTKLNQELKIERTGDNEYSYIYSDVKNPKTGVASVTLLLLVSFISIVAIIYYKDEFSLFKRI